MVTDSFGNKSFMHPMRRLSMPSWGDQFFSLRRGEGATFWVLPLFSMCSQSIILRFPKDSSSSQIVPPDVPNSTSILPLMVCPKCKLKRLPIEEHICFYFSTWGPKKYFYCEVPRVPKIWLWANQYCPFQKTKIKCDHTHELINTMAMHFMVRSNKIMRNDAM